MGDPPQDDPRTTLQARRKRAPVQRYNARKFPGNQRLARRRAGLSCCCDGATAAIALEPHPAMTSPANPIRHATIEDLAAIVGIYNASIPGRLATADTEPVTTEARRGWFADFAAQRRPLWVYDTGTEVAAWLSLRSFYGRPAYRRTVEVGVYVDPAHGRRGIGSALLAHALATAPGLDILTLLGFVFAHNAPSLALFLGHGFSQWGRLDRVAELDGRERDLLILGRRIEATGPEPAGAGDAATGANGERR